MQSHMYTEALTSVQTCSPTCTLSLSPLSKHAVLLSVELMINNLVVNPSEFYNNIHASTRECCYNTVRVGLHASHMRVGLHASQLASVNVVIIQYECLRFVFVLQLSYPPFQAVKVRRAFHHFRLMTRPSLVHSRSSCVSHASRV